MYHNRTGIVPGSLQYLSFDGKLSPSHSSFTSPAGRNQLIQCADESGKHSSATSQNRLRVESSERDGAGNCGACSVTKTEELQCKDGGATDKIVALQHHSIKSLHNIIPSQDSIASHHCSIAWHYIIASCIALFVSQLVAVALSHSHIVAQAYRRFA